MWGEECVWCGWCWLGGVEECVKVTPGNKCEATKAGNKSRKEKMLSCGWVVVNVGQRDG